MNPSQPSIVALIPARAGSKRVPGKNIRRLGEHPLLAYTIVPALDSGVFSSVIVSTDSEETAAIARHYGADVPFLRPAEFAGDVSPDIEWIEHLLLELEKQGRACDCFSLLRPTSPFRTRDTIRRAWDEFRREEGVDSLRAIEPCKQHPGKMWVVRGKRMLPLLPFGPKEQPWHSSQFQSLPEVFVQNASLEIAWTRVALAERTIAGQTMVPFVTDEREGFDINDEWDWWMAEEVLRRKLWELPPIAREPFGDRRSLG